MTWINTIINSANQSMTLKLPNGDKISFELIYMRLLWNSLNEENENGVFFENED